MRKAISKMENELMAIQKWRRISLKAQMLRAFALREQQFWIFHFLRFLSCLVPGFFLLTDHTRSMSSKKYPNSSNVRPPATHPAMTSNRMGARIFLVHLFGHNLSFHHRLTASLRWVPSLIDHTRSSS